jgi:hypothetical protein
MEKIKLLDVGDRFVKKCPADENNNSLLTIVKEDGVDFAAFLDDEIAGKVARACNNHDQLLAALKLARGVVSCTTGGHDTLIEIDAAIAAEGKS